MREYNKNDKGITKRGERYLVFGRSLNGESAWNLEDGKLYTSKELKKHIESLKTPDKSEEEDGCNLFAPPGLISVLEENDIKGVSSFSSGS